MLERIPTYRQAKKRLWDYLTELGWTMSNPKLKIPWADSPESCPSCRLWFKTRAMYKDSHSMHIDVRVISPEDVVERAKWLSGRTRYEPDSA